MLYAGEHAAVVYEARDARAGERRGRGARHRPGGHVERYVLRASEPGGARAIALTWAIVESARAAPGASFALAEATAVAFDRSSGHAAVREATPFALARFDRDGLRMHVAGCELAAGHARGALETGARRVAWDLTFEALAPPQSHFSHPWMYRTGTPTMKLASPFPDLRVSGEVTVDGVPWSVDGWPGAVCHVWGARHSDAYAWAHVNAWDEPGELVVEAVAQQEALGAVVRSLATVVLVRYRGVRYALNGVLDLARNRGEISARRFRFDAMSGQLAISGELWAETDDLVGLHFENPSGAPLHALTTQIARARVELVLRGGPPTVFHARSGGLELGTTNPDHGVRMYL